MRFRHDVTTLNSPYSVFPSLSFSVSTVPADMWEEAQREGFMPCDVNPNINNWQTDEADVTVTPAGSAATKQHS